MKTFLELAHIIVTILIYEGLKTFAKSDICDKGLGYLFFACFFLALTPIMISTAVLALIFVLVHQPIAAAIVAGLAVIGIAFRITNGFGTTWG